MMCCRVSFVWMRRVQSSEQQLSNEFLNGFRACKEMLKVEHTAVCLKTDVDAIWQILFCLMEQDAEEDEEQWGGGGAGCTHA